MAPPSVSSPEIVDQRSSSSDSDMAVLLNKIDVRFNIDGSFLRQDNQADLTRQYIAQVKYKSTQSTSN